LSLGLFPQKWLPAVPGPKVASHRVSRRRDRLVAQSKPNQKVVVFKPLSKRSSTARERERQRGGRPISHFYGTIHSIQSAARRCARHSAVRSQHTRVWPRGNAPHKRPKPRSSLKRENAGAITAALPNSDGWRLGHKRPRWGASRARVQSRARLRGNSAKGSSNGVPAYYNPRLAGDAQVGQRIRD
jgi:hypothetical protein